MTKAIPIYWKSKTILRVCYSWKDAETIYITKMMEDVAFTGTQAEQIERKTLRLTVVDLKERLVDGDVFSYSWLPTKSMWADMMTKEMQLLSSLENIILKNVLDLPRPLVNEVHFTC